MIYEDGRMDVMIDGTITTRAIDYVSTGNSDFFGSRMCLPQYMPKLFNGEHIAYSIGSDVPMIFKTYE